MTSVEDAKANLRTAAARHMLLDLATDELPDIGAAALVAGLDSPALRELAGLSRRDDSQEIGERFDAALQELNIPVTPTHAVDYMLAEYVSRWEGGELSAGDIGMKIEQLGFAALPLVAPEEEAALREVANDLERIEWTVPREKQLGRIEEALNRLRVLSKPSE